MASSPLPSGEVARHHVAHVGHQVGLGQVTAPVHAGDVEVGFSLAPQIQSAMTATSRSATSFTASSNQWAQVTGLAAKVRLQFLQGLWQSGNRQARKLVHLDFVHVVVAAQQQQPDLGLDTWPLSSSCRWPAPGI
jgi:hypothetical protein